MATVMVGESPLAGAVDTEAVGEGEERYVFGGLDVWLAPSLGVEGLDVDILLLLDGVENLPRDI